MLSNMLNFRANLSLNMLIGVMLIKKTCSTSQARFVRYRKNSSFCSENLIAKLYYSIFDYVIIVLCTTLIVIF